MKKGTGFKNKGISGIKKGQDENPGRLIYSIPYKEKISLSGSNIKKTGQMPAFISN